MRNSKLKYPELWYMVAVKDSHGRILSRERRPAHSFLKQWTEMVYRCHSGRLSVSCKCTDGVVRACAPNPFNPSWNSFRIAGGSPAPAGYSDFLGVVIGTDNTPVAIDDYGMKAKIGDGSGAGQMVHLANTLVAPAISAPTCSFSISRIFTNNSGGLITVCEAGIYYQFYADDGARRYCCGVRDDLAVPQDVPDGGSITVNYTVQVTA